MGQFIFVPFLILYAMVPPLLHSLVHPFSTASQFCHHQPRNIYDDDDNEQVINCTLANTYIKL